MGELLRGQVSRSSQKDGEFRASAGAVCGRNPASMQACDTLRDCQPQPYAFAAALAACCLKEPFEEVIQLLRRQAGAAVADGNADLPVGTQDIDVDRFPRR